MINLTAGLISCLVFALVIARPQLNREPAAYSTTSASIIKQELVSHPDGSYNSSYESSDGTKVENIGSIKRIVVPRAEDEFGKILDEHEEVIVVQSGSYSYTDPEGNLISVRYIADENGFQPQGEHLPVSP